MAGPAATIDADPTLRWQLANTAFPELYQSAEINSHRFLGGIALQNEVYIDPVETMSNPTTLLAAIQLARLGDEASLAVVQTNVMTDLAERLFKAGHQTRVHLDFLDGHLSQKGRRMADIQANALKHTYLNDVMLRRTRTEMKNLFFFEQLMTHDIMQTHNAVVWSPTPDDEKTKKDYNFFADTESCSVQLLSLDGTSVALDTALVAGKKHPAAAKHDVRAIYKLAATEGIEVVASDANDMISYVMLVPKTATPNGVSDIVKLYDQAVGDTFYGEAKPVQNYETYAQECQRRNDSFADVAQRITNQLLSEAHLFQTPFEAFERLDYLSEWYGVKQATLDTSLNAAVFGEAAARYIEDARRAMAMGDTETAATALYEARQVADSSSCPFFSSKSDEQGKNGSGGEEEPSKNKLMNCPHCKAKVYGDPCATVLSCWDCRAILMNGKEINKSDGGHRKREAEQAERARARKEIVQEAIRRAEEAKMAKRELAGSAA